MQRKIYDIAMNGHHAATKYAFNAALREIVRLVRERAGETGNAYELAARAHEKGADGYHVRASQVWQSSAESLVFTVNRVR